MDDQTLSELEQQNPEYVTEPVQPASELDSIGEMLNLSMYLPSIVRLGFGPSDYMEKDRRYQKIAKKELKRWEDANGKKFDQKLFVKQNSDGRTILNPELSKLDPKLKSNIHYEFAIKHRRLNKFYSEKERRRIYRDMEDDPEYRKLKTSLRPPHLIQATGMGQQYQKKHDQDHDRFVLEHPEKARAYARRDPEIKKALERKKTQDWNNKRRWRRRLDHVFNRDIIPDANKKDWMPKPIRRLDSWYQGKKTRFKNWFNNTKIGRLNRYIDRKLERIMSPFNRLNEAFLRTQNRAVNAVSNSAQRLGGRALSPFRSIGSRAFSPFARAGGGLKSLAQKAISKIATRIPGWIGMAAKGILAGGKAIAAIAKDGVGGLVKALSSITKQGVTGLAKQFAAMSVTTAASTPQSWIIGGIIAGVAVFLLLLIIILLSYFHETSLLGGDVNVNIQKRGPAEVPNPGPQTPADIENGNIDTNSQIIYYLDVTYSGPVSSLKVIDYLPTGVTYVSSEGANEPSVAGNVITWDIPISGATGNSNLTGSANLDDFNLAYFQSIGFPAPNGSVTLSQQGLQRWDNGAGQAILKAAQIVGIDAGLIGAWSFFEGINYDISYNLCITTDLPVGTPCDSDNWQVGIGVRPMETSGYLVDAFNAMYGSSDAATVQRVGQGVYNKTGRSNQTFPSVSASEAASNRSGSTNRQRLADLMRDEQIGAYVIAQLFKSYGNNVASTMRGWDGGNFYNTQNIINTIKSLYDAR